MAALFAATHPERTRALVLYEAMPRMSWAPDYDWALRREEREALRCGASRWGDGSRILPLAPSAAANPRLRGWFATARAAGRQPRHGRAAADDERPGRRPGGAALDPGADARRCTAPSDTFIDIRHSRYLAEHIPGARLVELPGAEALSFGDDDGRAARRDRGVPHRRPPGAATRAGPGHRDVLRHRRLDAPRRRARRPALARAARVDRRAPSAASSTASADARSRRWATASWPRSTARRAAIRCATAIREMARVAVRARDAQRPAHRRDRGDRRRRRRDRRPHRRRVGASAAPGEVLVSGTVKDLVVGSGIEFEDRGEHELRGVPGRVAAVGGGRVEGGSPAPAAARRRERTDRSDLRVDRALRGGRQRRHRGQA